MEAEIAELKEELKTATGQKRVKAVRRLDVLDAFYKSGNKPEWMVLNILPVLPPDLPCLMAVNCGLRTIFIVVLSTVTTVCRLLELNAPGIIAK